MADSLTTNLSLTKPEPGASADSWGGKLNDNFDDLDGIFKSDGTGTSVGLNVGSGKTLTIGGTATAPTQTLGDSSTKLATTAFVAAAITDLGLGDLATKDTTYLGDLALKDQVAQSDLASGVGNPAGMVAHFAMSTAPAGWLKANGAAVSRSTYAALFSAIGTTYGSGDGSTTFNVPDLRAEFIRGLDDSRGVDSGRAIGSSQLDQFQAARERYSQASSVNTGSNTYHATGGGGLQYDGVTAPLPTSGAIYAEVSGYGTPRYGSETRPRNVALLACIKY